MGSGSSHVETRWWEVEAQRILATGNTWEVKVICSLIPVVNETVPVDCLKKRPDLDTLFALNCGYQDRDGDQRMDPQALTVGFKANRLWQVLRMPPGCGKAPWNWNWQPPLEGIPSEIAAELHATVCQAIFRIPFSDFVKFALEYSTRAPSLNNLLSAVCDVRDSLRRAYQDRPKVQEIYVKVEKALKQQHHPLAHWIVASSLHRTPHAPFDTLTPNLEPIRAIFATRDFDLVLTRLAALNQRFTYGSQMYDWQKWSRDVDFWHCIDGVIWSGKFTAPPMRPHLSSEDRDERLRFLKGFEADAEDKAYSSWRRVVFSMKRLIGRDSQYSVKKGLLMSLGLLKDSPKRS
ncbi:hypothetical protein BKA61DRAFT_711986 [Leptodontidium sp. MPI-SDFR-AT-0119]|nr:hypothetical protein BKA61DRAFT_711986 [Leptodontidium sp. MPI-SDFR-AT-0119]